jgi:hypothetical protein
LSKDFVNWVLAAIMASSISVKDISEMGAVKVPSKFILNATELATIVPHNYFSDEQVPVIDLAGLDDNSQGEATMAAIANPCENWGFFQVGLVNSLYHLSRCED